MDHAHAREMLSDGRTSAELDAHLTDCADCRLHADALDTVLHHAPSLVPAAPRDLRQRLLRDVAGIDAPAVATAGEAAREASGAGSDGGARILPFPARRLATAAAAIATAAAVVAVGLVTSPPADPPTRVLAAAVDGVHGPSATSFRFEVAGRTQVRLPPIRFDGGASVDGTVELDPTLPSPPSAPEVPEFELPPLASAPEPPPRPNAPGPSGVDPGIALPEFSFDLPIEIPTIEIPRPPPVEIPTVEAPDLSVLQGLTLDGLCAEVPIACADPTPELPSESGYLDGLSNLLPDLPRPEREILVQRVHLALELERLGVDVREHVGLREEIGLGGLTLEFDGSGESDGRQASGYTIGWRTVEPVAVSGSLDVVVEDDRVWLRTSGAGAWLRTTVPPAFRLGPVTAPHDLDDVLDQLNAPGTSAEDLGTDTLRGVRVRGLVVVDGALRTEVWVGVDDGLVHRIRLEHRSGGVGGAQVVSTTIFDLYDHGAPVEVTIPTESLPLEHAPLVELPPFWIDPSSAATRS